MDDLSSVPAEMKVAQRWVVWRREPKKDKPNEFTKVPYQAKAPSRKASSTRAAEWSTFAEAVDAVSRRTDLSGVGYVLGNGWAGVDCDHCVDAATGVIQAWATQIIRDLDSYSEFSPSGEGVKIFVRGELPPGRRKIGNLEMYSRDRFFTVTGRVVPDESRSTVEERTDALRALHQKYEPPTKLSARELSRGLTTPAADDSTILDKARRAKNGAKFRQLYDAGDYKGAGYPSPSEADQALANMLVWWAHGDLTSADRLFRGSALFRPKWDERHGQQTYGAGTLSEALTVFRKEAPRHHIAVQHDGDEAAATQEIRGWPQRPARAAFAGFAGSMVDAIEPHSESDPAALLLQTLVAFGNLVGRSPFYLVDGTRHHVNENILLVGSTASGRKGTSWQHVKRILGEADAGWASTQIGSGLSSGEGLIYNVRDPSPSHGQGQGDPGISDKRLLVLETEFAAPLRVIRREGNTLSTTIRHAWDTGELRSMTKNSPVAATGAHVSIIGHITSEELGRFLQETDIANGFLNRFLLVAVKRSKRLPEGGAVSPHDIDSLSSGLREIVKKARNIGRMERDKDARELWAAVYDRLTERPGGLLGKATSRAAAHVVRLSCIYALLAGSATVTRPHLESALAVWDYIEDSTRFYLGGSLGDPIADAILAALHGAGREGLKRTAIHDLGAHHWKAADLARALQRLVTDGLAIMCREHTGGRPVEMWRAAKFAEGVIALHTHNTRSKGDAA